MKKYNFDKIAKEIDLDAYNRGVDDTLKAISDAVQNLKTRHPDEPPSPKRDGTKLLLNVIKTKPGLRSRDIIESLPTVNEKATRNNLWRLKKRGDIEKRGDSWYPAA